MAQMIVDKLDRITVTLPKSLVAQVEERIVAGHYATTTEWIRHAIREQLQREKSPIEQLIEKDERVAKSLEQARTGQVVQIDLDALIESHSK